jgi:hypothetical protein
MIKAEFFGRKRWAEFLGAAQMNAWNGLWMNWTIEKARANVILVSAEDARAGTEARPYRT